ncbi:hypothetical protein XENOCAPTIV_028691 [Xenoophorus captivus]|uniref:Piezo TM1-24 domain-containing protein n=1 Tax=Xenoophorus captivus TaxID=1517983 RepID=A0ABV0QG51_9TELE
MMSAPFLAIYGSVLVVLGFLSGLRLSRAELYPGLPPAVIVDFDLNSYHPAPCIHLGAKVVVYKILYIVLFLLCVVLYQIRYDVWRRVLKTFWAVVVGYSMVVLIAIYMYQFRSVSALFRQIMGMSEEG